MSFDRNDANMRGDGDMRPPPQEDDDLPSAVPIQDEGLETPPPLSLEDTLLVILRHVPSFQELKAFRLVNSTWNMASSRELNRRCSCCISFCVDWRRRPLAQENGLQDMRRFVELLNNTRTWKWMGNIGPVFPCAKFLVDAAILYCDPSWPHDKQAVVTSFFQGVAPFVKELTLTDSSREIDQRFFPSAPPARADFQFPVLRRLNFDLGNLRGHPAHFVEVVESNWDFVRNVMANSPRLAEVHVGSRIMNLDEFNDDNGATRDLSSLVVLNHLPQRLPKLTLSGDLQDMQMGRLETVESVRHLRELHLHLHPDARGNPLSRETLYRFLEVQSGSLRTLSIHICNLDLPFPIRLPSLPHLENLELDSYWYLAGAVTLDSHFPALQKLALRARELAAFLDFAWVAQPMRAVTEFELRYSTRPSSQEFAQVARVLPSLRKLNLISGEWRLGRDIDLQDLAPLQNVKELSLHYTIYSNADKLLTCLSERRLDFLQSLPSSLLTMASLITADPPPFLHQLIKLKIKGQGTLTDVGCRVALLKLRNLTCLDLKDFVVRPPGGGISDQALAEMRNKFRVIMD